MDEIRHPRRPDAAGQARRPRGARRRAASTARVTGVARRPPVLVDGSRRRRRQRRVVHRLPAGLRLDRPAGPRRGRLAGGVPRRRSTTRPGSSSAASSFQYAFSSMVLPGVGRDAEYVADRIVARAARRRLRPLRRPDAAWPARHGGSRDGRRRRRWRRPATAYERGEWDAAYEALVRAPTRSALDDRRPRPASPTAAYLLGRHDESRPGPAAGVRAQPAERRDPAAGGAVRVPAGDGPAAPRRAGAVGGWAARAERPARRARRRTSVERGLGRLPADVRRTSARGDFADAAARAGGPHGGRPGAATATPT